MLSMFQAWKWEFFLLNYKLCKLGKLAQLSENLMVDREYWWLGIKGRWKTGLFYALSELSQGSVRVWGFVGREEWE